MNKSNVTDSGERKVHETGAQRDRYEGKGRMDLLPMRALMKLSELFEAGAIKYDARNWEKGIPLSSLFDSALRHLAKVGINQNDEPHLVQAAWNIICMLDTSLRILEDTLPDNLNDLSIDIVKLTEIFPHMETENDS